MSQSPVETDAFAPSDQVIIRILDQVLRKLEAIEQQVKVLYDNSKHIVGIKTEEGPATARP